MLSAPRFFSVACFVVFFAVSVSAQSNVPGSASDNPEARKAFDRGCLLLALDRHKDALPLLETAASIGPLPSMDGCTHTPTNSLDAIRSTIERAKTAYQHCLAEADSKDTIQQPTTGKKVKKKKVNNGLTPNALRDIKRQSCESTYGYAAGDYQAVINAETKQIQDAEVSLSYYPPGVLASQGRSTNDLLNLFRYEERGLSFFALGNPLAALRDLQTSMDLYQRYPQSFDVRIYFHRAVVLSDIGNLQGAVDDCRAVLTFKNFNSAPYAEKYCVGLTADNRSNVNANPAAPGGVSSATPFNPVASSSDATIRAEIEKVRGGQYTPLPPIQSIGASTSRNGMAVFEVRNDTTYALTALFSGPIERRIEVAPGTSTSVELPPGAYKLVGRVNTPGVLPSYGEHTFDQGSSGLRFFLQ